MATTGGDCWERYMGIGEICHRPFRAGGHPLRNRLVMAWEDRSWRIYMDGNEVLRLWHERMPQLQEVLTRLQCGPGTEEAVMCEGVSGVAESSASARAMDAGTSDALPVAPAAPTAVIPTTHVESRRRSYRRPDEGDCEAVCAAYGQGMTSAEVSEQVGISPMAVRQILRDAGVVIRRGRPGGRA